VRAVATDLEDQADSNPDFITFTAGPNCGNWLRENAQGQTEIIAPVFLATQSSISTADFALPFGVQIIIPAGAVLEDTALTVTYRDAEEFDSTLGDLQGIGLFFDLSLANGQIILAGGAEASLSTDYPDADSDGLIDGFAIPETLLKLYWYDGAEWQVLADSQIETSLNRITATTSQTGTFALLGSPLPVEAWRDY